MPERVDHKTIFTLSEVSLSIRKTLADRYTSSFWVKAEMNKLNYYKHSGHCYPELVEKNEGRVTAQLRSHLWRDDYHRINQKFQQILREPLQDGIKILFEARVTFDPVHGLSLWILDMDPTFTLGDLEREKQDSLLRLQQERLYAINKRKALPLIPQRIAIISVETSKGYADFMQIIQQNPWHYAFATLLFPALLQGDKAAADIRKQLYRIKHVAHHFDLVAIIRGGGGDVGLSCYNDFELAKTICEFPIPVITGIGHSTNETVCELISHYNAITPTKLAEFLIQQYHNVSVPVKEAQEKMNRLSMQCLEETQRLFQLKLRTLTHAVERLQLRSKKDLVQQSNVVKELSFLRMKEEQHQLVHLQHTLLRSGRQFHEKHKQRLEQLEYIVAKEIPKKIKEQAQQLQHVERQLELLKPEQVLKRGYSITRHKGKAIRSSQEVQSGDSIETIIFEGALNSVITTTHEKK